MKSVASSGKRGAKSSKTRNLVCRNGWWHFRILVDGADKWVSLGVQDKIAAIELAEVLRNTALAERSRQRLGLPTVADEGILAKLGMLRKRQAWATIGEVIVAYEADAKSRDIKEISVGKNVSSLRLVVATALGVDRAKVDDLSVSVLTADLLRAYKAEKIKQAKPLGPAAMSRSETTAKSTVQQARSIFAAEALQGLGMRVLRIPSMAEFMALSLPGTTLKRWRRPDDAIVARLTSEVSVLRESSPARWLAFMLTGNMGLRRGSAVMARWDWVRIVEGEPILDVYPTDEAVAKGSEYSVMVDRSVWADMLAVKAADAVYIVPGADLGERQAVLAENVSWMRSIGIDADKPTHELRKLFVDKMKRTHGVSEAQGSAGHSSPHLQKAYTTAGSTKSVRLF